MQRGRAAEREADGGNSTGSHDEVKTNYTTALFTPATERMDRTDSLPLKRTQEAQLRLSILKRLGDRQNRISEALQSGAESFSTDQGARASRLLGHLLSDVTAALDDAYRRRLQGTLHPIEATHWLPALEAVRRDLRTAAATWSATRGARLEHAVNELRRSMQSLPG
jgi:hypothetical protein